MPDGNIKDIVSEMARGIAGLWMITIVDSDSMVLASWQGPDNQVSPDALGGFIQLFNTNMAAFKQSAVGFSRFEDIIFSTTTLHQVIKPLAEATAFLIVSAPRSVPLGIIRTGCNNYAPRIEQAIPGYGTPTRSDGTGTTVP